MAMIGEGDAVGLGTGRPPCPCTNPDGADEIQRRILDLIDRTTPLIPLKVVDATDTANHYSWQVTYYCTRAANELATDHQADPRVKYNCKDRKALYFWAEDLTVGGTQLFGTNHTRKLQLVRGPAKKLITAEEAAARNDGVETVGQFHFVSVPGTRLYPVAQYAVRCQLCRRTPKARRPRRPKQWGLNNQRDIAPACHGKCGTLWCECRRFQSACTEAIEQPLNSYVSVQSQFT